MEAYWLVNEMRWEEEGPLAEFVKGGKGPVLFCAASLQAANPRQEARIQKMEKVLRAHVEAKGTWLFFLSIGEMTTWLKAHPIDRLVTSVAHLPRHKEHKCLVKAALPADCLWEETERQLLMPLGSVKTKADAPYKVFTPFYRNMRKQIDGRRQGCQRGDFEGQEQWQGFLEKLHAYGSDRDRMDRAGGSGMSKFLRFGEVSPCRLVEDIWRAPASDGGESWIRQLIWREFYYQVYEAAPEAMRENWNGAEVVWESNDRGFEMWKAGETGVPVVDAAMRQLAQTGDMHNRARMIAASFLVKDLHVDWRQGEGYFSSQLVDADPYLNNGGWQWVASTGCDAQPYFRIFNPWSQGKRYDPDAKWIKAWVPELQNIDEKAIHSPKENRGYGYKEPICNHRVEAEIAKSYYRKKG